jgi:oligopeptidase B|tara:strand:+ start:283 stop:660 length:378 start_codon:yes stop_codon:yes gene_type:complete
MSDASIPLTTEEWEEWGNPHEPRFRDYMLSYSPMDNVRPGATYPALLIAAGLNDPRVAYWEPTKWAQRLRATIANGDEVLLKMDLSAGHSHSSDRYHYLRELAFEYAFLLEKLQKLEPTPETPIP